METIQQTYNDLSIKLNDVKISYNDLGTGAVPVIFVHGFPFDKSSWYPQMEYLQDKHRVIAYDIRGFGKSSAGKENESMSLFADDLINFMDALDISKAIVCGLSMGGYILLNAVYRYPKRFAAIILSDTQCIADSLEVKQKRYQTISGIIAGKFAAFAEGFVKNVFCQETLNTKKELVESTKQTILSTSTITVTKTLSALALRWDMCSSLPEISVPSLILCGNEDAVTPPAQSVFLHNAIPHSTMFIINNAGHLSNLEQPEEYNKRLIDFISTVKL